MFRKLGFKGNAKVRVVLFLTFILIVTSYSNCASKHSETNIPSQFDAEATLRILQSQSLTILEKKCASCHTANFQDSNLKSILDLDYLRQNGYIEIGSPQESLIYLRVIDGFMPPQTNPQLTQEEIAVLRDWISALGGNFNTIIGGVDDSPMPTPGAPGRFSQVAQIIQQRCANCHGGQTDPNLTLPHAQLINETTRDGSRVVVPRDVGMSRLYQSVVANSMPRGQAPLSNAQKEIIRSWIAAGAMND